jgi:hypothetical protein
MANPNPIFNNQNALRAHNFANLPLALRAEYARKATIAREKRRREEYLTHSAVLKIISAPAKGANGAVILDDDGNELTRFDIALQNAFAIFNRVIKDANTSATPNDVRTILDSLRILQDLAGQRNIKYTADSDTQSPLEKLIAKTFAGRPLPGAPQ